MSLLTHSLPASLLLAALFCTGGAGMDSDRFHGGAGMSLRRDGDIPLRNPPGDTCLRLSEQDEEQDMLSSSGSRAGAAILFSPMAAILAHGSLRGRQSSLMGAPKTGPPQPT